MLILQVESAQYVGAGTMPAESILQLLINWKWFTVSINGGPGS